MATQEKGYVDAAYLDAMARIAAPGKRLGHQRMRISPGAAVLDVGCGPATDTLPLAELVGPGGRVEGVDHDPEMVAEAIRRAEAAGVADRVHHRQADALALPFADAAFDATHSERLLMHLREPERALAEMVRVTRPGGWVVVADTDWGSRSVDTSEVDAERKMGRVMAELSLENGYSGRRLYGMLRRAGLAEVAADPVALHVTSYDFWRRMSRTDLAEAEAVRAGILTEDEVRRLDESLRAKDAEGTFYAGTTLVVVSGRRP